MPTVTTDRAAPKSTPNQTTRADNPSWLVWQHAARRLSEQIALRDTDPSRRRVRLATISVTIFLLALGVRLLRWQDNYTELELKGPWVGDVSKLYKAEALRMLREGGILYPNRPQDSGDGRLILHPPGFSALMAAIYAVSGESDSAVILAKIGFDALSTLMVFLIAIELFNTMIAVIAATLASLSPHFV